MDIAIGCPEVGYHHKKAPKVLRAGVVPAHTKAKA